MKQIQLNNNTNSISPERKKYEDALKSFRTMYSGLTPVSALGDMYKSQSNLSDLLKSAKMSEANKEQDSQTRNLRPLFTEAGLGRYSELASDRNLSPEQEAQMKAVIGDYQQKISDSKFMNDKNQEALALKRASYDRFSEGLDDVNAQLAGAGSKIEESIRRGEEAAIAYRDRMEEVYDDLKTTADRDWQKVRDEYKDMTADTIQSVASSITGNYDRELSDLTARAKEGDVEARAMIPQVKAAKHQAIGQELSRIKTARNDMVAQINSNMASLKAENMKHGASLLSYGHKNYSDVMSQVLPNLRASWAMNSAEINLSIEQMRNAGQNDIADFIAAMPLHSVSVGPTVALLAELTSQGAYWYGDERGAARTTIGSVKRNGDPQELLSRTKLVNNNPNNDSYAANQSSSRRTNTAADRLAGRLKSNQSTAIQTGLATGVMRQL
jgi:hypothetical protein